MNKSDLKPASVFEQFAKINQIPRPSKHEEKMIAYLRQWGESHGLETKVDETGNVLIRKPATKGYENHKTVILQSHMDMVCDKLVDVEFDFDNDAIQTYVDGEWLTAKGTTLGADDGIGCAIELAILEANDIEHGPLECVFTRDEETGLTGAEGMKPGFMTGDYLINLDSEDEGEMFVSCAGGRNTQAKFTFTREDAPEGSFFLRAQLKGLIGGHSGDDINKQRANAIKLLGRFLFQTMNRYEGVRLAQFHSGKLHNAIPRDGQFVIAVPHDVKENVKADWNVFAAQVEDEFHVTDTQMEWMMESTEAEPVIEAQVARNFVWALQAIEQHCRHPFNGKRNQYSLVTAFQCNVEPRQYVCYHRGHLPTGRCRGAQQRRLSRMEDACREPSARHRGEGLQGTIRQGTHRSRHTRRTGVRTIF